MRKMDYRKFIILSFVMVVIPQYTWAVIRYVDVDAAGSNNGTSWSNAYTSLQSALSVAVSGDEIWVAEGTYKPSVQHIYYDETPSTRYQSFQMKNGVGIYGGFGGIGVNETSREQRNPTSHVTILSGNIGDPNTNTDNCYHVFYHPEPGTGGFTQLNSTAILDGFTIRDGYANGPVLSIAGTRHQQGAGMWSVKSSATIANCIFTNNIAVDSGGAMFHTNCTLVTDCIDLSLTISNTTFSNNSVVPSGVAGPNQVGGGVYTTYTTATFTNSTFTGNISYDGGGLYSYKSTITLTNSTFSSNTALVSSANPSSTGIGGGIFFDECSTSNLINSTFSNNSAGSNNPAIGGSAGAIFNYKSSPTLTNCTISENSAGQRGGGMANDTSSNPRITNSILWGNSAVTGAQIFNSNATSVPVVTYSDVQGGYSGTGNRNVNPLFVNVATNDFHLQPTSPCIDVGNNAASNLPTTDFEGDMRVADGDRNGTATVDMGVDEVVSGNNYLLWTK